MYDVWDGYGWCTIQADLVRQKGSKLEMEDVDVKNLKQCFVDLLCGLLWQINIDWYIVRYIIIFYQLELKLFKGSRP